MPRDVDNRYITARSYFNRTITRSSCRIFFLACNSTRITPRPYPTMEELMAQVDTPGDSWFQDRAPDLHLHNLVWFGHMRAAQRLTKQEGLLSGDRVLGRLMEEGLCDRCAPDVPNLLEEHAMGFSAVLSTRL